MALTTWTIEADNRERAGGVVEALAAYPQVVVAVGRLPLGDYLPGGGVVVERKTAADLVLSIRDRRLDPLVFSLLRFRLEQQAPHEARGSPGEQAPGIEQRLQVALVGQRAAALPGGDEARARHLARGRRRHFPKDAGAFRSRGAHPFESRSSGGWRRAKGWRRHARRRRVGSSSRSLDRAKQRRPARRNLSSVAAA
jgi:hypothetical protein